MVGTISDGKHVGLSADPQVRIDADATAFDHGFRFQWWKRWSAAATPDQPVVPQGLAASELNLGLCDSGHLCFEVQPDLASLQGGLSSRAIEGTAAGQDLITNLNQVNQSTALQQVRQFASQLDTGRTGSDDHKSGIGLTLLTQELNTFPQRGDIVEAVEPL